MNAFMDVNIWMIVGFLLAAYSVVANDSLQTLGTYISSNKKRTPKAVQMLFICTVTIIVLMMGWFLKDGDPAWGRLSVPGKEFPLPEPFNWVYILPPIAVLALTQWGAPVSTSFLVLSSFKPANIGKLLNSSLTGYVLAFCVGLAAYGLGMWLLERWVFRRTQEGKDFNKVWYGLQWFSTGFLWSMWLVQTWRTSVCSCPASWTSSPWRSARRCCAWVSACWWPPAVVRFRGCCGPRRTRPTCARPR